MTKTITIMDIAKECGLSKSTVGYVLSGYSAGKVSAKNVELIKAVAERLGYCPNTAARTLSSGKSNTIGIMLPSPENRFYASLSMALQRRLTEKGYIPFFSYWESMYIPSYVQSSYENLKSRGVDGIIVCELKSLNIDNRLPTVIYGKKYEDFDSVFFEEHAKFINLVLMLKSWGYKKIAYIGSRRTERNAGYLEGLEQAGLEFESDFVFYQKFNSSLDGVAGVRKFLSLREKPDAVICANDEIAIAAIGEALKNNVKIPQEMAFTGSDDIKDALLCHPALTTLKRSTDEIADLLIEMLLRRIGDCNASPMHKTMDLELIIRESARPL